MISDPVPAIGAEDDWKPSATVEDGSPASQRIELEGADHWLISLEYDSRRPLRVTSPEIGLDTTVPANLDFRGETPTFPVAYFHTGGSGAESIEVTVEPVEPNLLARVCVLPTRRTCARSPRRRPAKDSVRRVPLSEACGRYVDWYAAK